jgi:hypothetical protein
MEKISSLFVVYVLLKKKMKMKSRVLLYTALLLAIFSASCSKEDRYTPEQEPELKENTIAYTVAVKDGTATRASLNGTSYIFQAEDKLYVTGDGGNVHGILNLVSGAGTSSATFSGDLSYPSGDEPSPTLIINATLVSATDKIHDITTNPGFVNATVYPTSVDAIASSLQEAVEWYSDFTAESEYAKKSFTLHQNSAFLNFTVRYVDLPETILDESTDKKTVAINFTNHLNDGHTTDPVSARSGSMVLKEESEDIVTNFVAAFPDGTVLNKAIITVQVGGGDYPERPFYLTNATLAGNKKYNVSRISSSEFAVQTRNANTTIRFNYVSEGDCAQYKMGSAAWTDYAPNQVLTVEDAETVVLFRSKRTANYKNQTSPTNPNEWPKAGGKPIFTFSDSVFVYGDIMSLKCTGEEGEYIRGTTVSEYEFAGAFWDKTSDPDNIYNNHKFIRIHQQRYFVLSAQHLSNNCYQNMFRENKSIKTGKHIIISAKEMAPFCCNGMFKGCTALQSAPVIKATKLAESCCQSMFEDCNMTEVPALPATELAVSCYRQMFRNSRYLTSVPQDLLSHITTLEPYCFFSMFEGCSRLTVAPDLPAATLVYDCYESMFKSTKIQSIRCLATNYTVDNTDHQQYSQDWMSGVPSSGTFIIKAGADWGDYRGVHGIPSGWTVVEE